MRWGLASRVQSGALNEADAAAGRPDWVHDQHVLQLMPLPPALCRPLVSAFCMCKVVCCFAAFLVFLVWAGAWGSERRPIRSMADAGGALTHCGLGCLQDDEAELLKELNRIKAERAEEQAKQAAAAAAESQSALQQELARGNPLIAQADFQVGWYALLHVDVTGSVPWLCAATSDLLLMGCCQKLSSPLGC